jgi:hypothetical protein
MEIRSAKRPSVSLHHNSAFTYRVAARPSPQGDERRSRGHTAAVISLRGRTTPEKRCNTIGWEHHPETTCRNLKTSLCNTTITHPVARRHASLCTIIDRGDDVPGRRLIQDRSFICLVASVYRLLYDVTGANGRNGTSQKMAAATLREPPVTGPLDCSLVTSHRKGACGSVILAAHFTVPPSARRRCDDCNCVGSSHRNSRLGGTLSVSDITVHLAGAEGPSDPFDVLYGACGSGRSEEPSCHPRCWVGAIYAAQFPLHFQHN